MVRRLVGGGGEFDLHDRRVTILRGERIAHARVGALIVAAEDAENIGGGQRSDSLANTQHLPLKGGVVHL